MTNTKVDKKNQTKLDKNYTPALHFIQVFKVLLIKNYKAQLPVLLFLAVLHQLHQQIYFFQGIFRKTMRACIMNKKRDNLGQPACEFIFWSKKILNKIQKEHCVRTQ